MNQCECGCGRLVRGHWYRNHKWRSGRGNSNPEPDAPVAFPGPEAPDGPPPYPAPLDRRRWRLASERPGTSPFNPWVETRCSQCHEKMWTRDVTSTFEHGGLCEEDEYRFRTEIQERAGQRFNTQARTVHDPFRPKA